MEIEKVVEELHENLVKTKKVHIDFVKENFLTDDPVKLNRLIMAHGPKFAYYAGLYAMARKKTYFSKQARDDFYTTKYVVIKDNALKQQTKITESHLEHAIKSRPEYKELETQYLKDKSNEDTLYEMRESLKSGKDLLWTLASNVRAEQKAVYTEIQ